MKNTAKLLTLLLIISVVATSAAFLLSACNDYTETLVVYNWEEYIDVGDENAGIPSVNDQFVAEYNAKYGTNLKLQYETFDTNETMLAKVTKGDFAADVICPSEYAIQKLWKSDLIQPIDKTGLENINNNVDPIFATKLSDTFGSEIANFNDYLVPYMYGTLGILYNAKEISAEQIEEAGWGILWNDVADATLKEKLNGKIYMKDSVRDAMVAAVGYLVEKGELIGEVSTLINDKSEAVIDAVQKVLQEQSQGGYLKGYEVDNGKDEMIAGNAFVNLAWSGDAMYAISDGAEAGMELAYYAPAVGGNLWFDGWVMAKREGVNTRAAREYLDFMCRPDVAMKNMMEILYTSAVKPEVFQASEAALAILEENEYVAAEFFADEAIYPGLGDTTHLGVMKDFGDSTDDLNTMWENVKTSGGSGTDVLMIVFIVVAVVIVLGAVGFLAFIFRDKKKSRRKIAKKS